MRMIVTGGGTGGHLFPGIAVAEAMLSRFPQGKVLFVSTGRAIDNKALADKPFATEAIVCQGLKGKSVAGIVKSMVQLPLSLWQAMRLIRKFKPQIVLGVGGYVTGPVVLAARLLGVKTCIHEQNSVPGITNRILGKIVNRIYTSIPGSEKYFAAGKTVATGNPVRKEILAQADDRQTAGSRKTLLVLGGSQGAHQVNRLVTSALAGAGLPEGFRVIHQTGSRDEAWVRKAYADHNITAEVASFINDMPAVYGQADLVVSRAGATTLAELTALGKPAILIPFPFAADDHQRTNALFLVDGGGARMFLEKELDAESLKREILTLFGRPDELARMAENMKKLGRPDATETIVTECAQLLAAA